MVLRRFFIALLLTSAALGVNARDALAQAVDPTLTPPRVLEQAPAIYPASATGAAEVVLHLVVGEDGSVGDVVVLEGGEPFATSAVEAARAYRFEPARRAGKPVRARIKVVVSFAPPPPPRRALPTPDDPLPEALPGEAPAAPSRVEEVRVVGIREPKTPTEHRMGRAELRVVPGAFGDPFRAIDVLPSLVPIVSGLPYFYIRGAPPSAVGYYVDEVRVPYLFHFALGPGVIHPALVEEVALHPAALPGRYGRFAGGVVAGTTRDPAKELYGEGQIRLFDAGAYVEAPFAGGKGAAGVGGRYAYPGPLLSLFAPNLTINYRDYNARVSYDVSERWRASVFTFGSFDYASETERSGRENVYFASEFHRVDVRFDHRGGDGSVTRVATTFGLDRTRLEDARFAQSLLVGARGRHQRRLGRHVDVEVGVDALAEHYTGELPNQYAVSRRDYQSAETLFAPRTDSATGAWVSATYRPAEGWDLTATMRGDVFTSAGKVLFGPSPRTSMRVPLSSRVAFLGALGVAPQPPAFAIPVPAVGYRGLPGGLVFGYQKSAGLELKLPWRFTLKTVGFHHSYVNLRDFSQERGDLDLNNAPPLANAPTQAFGVELFLSRKLSERYAAFASVNLSRAELGSSQLTKAQISPFDRTYVAQVGGVIDLGRNWRASSRFLTYGGWPMDPPLASENTGRRLPPFYRVDLRIEKRWIWKERRYIGLVFEGLNVTGSQEIVSRTCTSGGACNEQKLGPIVIPSIGVEGAL